MVFVSAYLFVTIDRSSSPSSSPLYFDVVVVVVVVVVVFLHPYPYRINFNASCHPTKRMTKTPNHRLKINGMQLHKHPKTMLRTLRTSVMESHVHNHSHDILCTPVRSFVRRWFCVRYELLIQILFLFTLSFFKKLKYELLAHNG